VHRTDGQERVPKAYIEQSGDGGVALRDAATELSVWAGEN
jgi:hypothetical protein